MAAENEVVGKEVEETAAAAVAEATAAVEDAGMAPPAVVADLKQRLERKGGTAHDARYAHAWPQEGPECASTC